MALCSLLDMASAKPQLTNITAFPVYFVSASKDPQMFDGDNHLYYRLKDGQRYGVMVINESKHKVATAVYIDGNLASCQTADPMEKLVIDETDHGEQFMYRKFDPPTAAAPASIAEDKAGLVEVRLITGDFGEPRASSTKPLYSAVSAAAGVSQPLHHQQKQQQQQQQQQQQRSLDSKLNTTAAVAASASAANPVVADGSTAFVPPIVPPPVKQHYEWRPDGHFDKTLRFKLRLRC